MCRTEKNSLIPAIDWQLHLQSKEAFMVSQIRRSEE